jgi:hypothetical protein
VTFAYPMLETRLSALKLIGHGADEGLTPPAVCGRFSISYVAMRVTRALRCQFPDVDLTVCDINRNGVVFCARKIKAIGIYGTGDFEEMEMGRSFDLILVRYSVD